MGWKVAVTVRFSSSEPPLRTWTTASARSLGAEGSSRTVLNGIRTTVSSQLAELLVGVSPETSTASTEMPAPP